MTKNGKRGRINEIVINQKISEILCNYHGWVVRAENTGRIVGNKRLKPDIIIEAHGSAVVMETEYHPASDLNDDVDRLIGMEVKGLGDVVSIIGVKMPVKIREYDGDDLVGLLKSSTFEYYTKNKNERFPHNGFLKGTLADISAAVTLTSIPWDKIEYCVGLMEKSIDRIAVKIKSSDARIRKKISISLGDSYEETTEMAALVLLNAGIFHEEVATHHPGIRSMSEISGFNNVISQETLIKEWNIILGIDYAPIFETAIAIIRYLPASVASDVLEVMYSTISEIVSLKMTKSGDVYGELYQRMLSIRKNIAAFYTRPVAAALLTGLVMPDSSNDIWKNNEKIKKMRIADFACGSGMLLTHAYYHIKHCLDGDVSKMHKHLMENCFYGYDIMPTATHLTVSNLAGIYPDVLFDGTNIFTLPIGESEHGYHLGSLDLLKDTSKFVTAGLKHGGSGSRNVDAATMNPNSCDYILMNPPYSRPTNHAGGRDDPVPGFAVFGIPHDTQRKMGKLKNKMFSKTCAHGHAGWASNFIAICDRKIKPGGVVGLVLPSTVVKGASWSKVRKLFSEYYDNITVVYVKRKNPDDNTYSSDTSMNEVLLIGRRREQIRSVNDKARIKTVVLSQMPQNRLHAIETSKVITKTLPNRLEDDMSNTTLFVGNDMIGNMLDCPTDLSDWWVIHTQNIGTFSLAYKITHQELGIPMTRLANLVTMGKHHLDIIGDKSDGSPQGPFMKIPFQKNSKYQSLWNNDNETQKCIIVEPDCTLEKKHNAIPTHVDRVWNTATCVHINYQVGYASQSIISAYTTKPTIGGRTWPNIIIDKKYERAFTLWCNSVFGILIYWSKSGSQQPGRGMMSLTSFRALPILDFSKLNKKQLLEFDQLFTEVGDKQLKEISQLQQDPIRKKIDDGIVKILGITIDLDPVYTGLSELLLDCGDIDGDDDTCS